MNAKEILQALKKAGSKKNAEGMKRFGITESKALGNGVPYVRELAGKMRRSMKNDSERLNSLARQLWSTGYHEARLLAIYISDINIGWSQAKKWLYSSKNWAEVDQLCGNLLWKFRGIEKKALLFCEQTSEWVKRAGFVLMAVLAVRKKDELDEIFVRDSLRKIREHSTDKRNFIRKAVNWALRQIGKSTNGKYYAKALGLAVKLSQAEDRTARWIGSDARRELERLEKKVIKEQRG